MKRFAQVPWAADGTVFAIFSPRAPDPGPVRQAGDGLASLRRQLPPATAIWAGGEMTRRIRKTLPGVLLVSDIGGTIAALKALRAQANATVPPSSPAVPR